MLNQRVALTFGTVGLADQFQSVADVRCPDCTHRLCVAYEYGDPPGLLDVDLAQQMLLEHARRSPRPHPTLLGVPAPAQRSA